MTAMNQDLQTRAGRMPRSTDDAPVVGPVVGIVPGCPPLRPWLAEVWQTRRIARLLAVRSLKARYRQTVLGAGWAVIQPLLLMLVFWAFFGSILEVPATGSASYPVFAFTGIVLWQFFVRSLAEAGGSIVHSAHFVTKVYFPRIHLPLAALGIALADLAAALVCLALMLALTATIPDVRVLALPFILALLLVTGAGAAFWLAALQVRYRDVGQLVPFLTQALMFASPVIYPATLVPPDLQRIYGLNPMVTVIEGARWALLHGPGLDPVAVAVSCGFSLLLFLTGLEMIRRTEPHMADLV